MAERATFVVMCAFVGVVVFMAWWAWKKDQAKKTEKKREMLSEEEKKLQENRMIVFLILVAAFAIMIACILVKAVFPAVLVGLFVLVILPVWNAVAKSNKFNKK